MSPFTGELLINRMPQRLEQEDFVRLYTEHEAAVRRCVYLWIGNWNDAQDVLQNVHLLLWRKSGHFRPGTSFLAWALRVAKLETRDYWKRKSRDRRVFSDEFFDLVSDDALAMSEDVEKRRIALRHCLDKLKQSHRELIKLRYDDNKKLQAVASEMGRTVDAVQKALARIRQSLFQCITNRISSQTNRS
jgi:RNA polymerase sigma-70 factor (ECF subfamily)